MPTLPRLPRLGRRLPLTKRARQTRCSPAVAGCRPSALAALVGAVAWWASSGRRDPQGSLARRSNQAQMVAKTPDYDPAIERRVAEWVLGFRSCLK